MNSIIFLLTVSLLFLTGVHLLFYSKKDHQQITRGYTIKGFVRSTKNSLLADTDDAAELFASAQIPFSIKQYNAVRIVFVFAAMLYGVSQYLQTRNFNMLLITYVLAIVIYGVSIPRRTIFGIVSPFISVVKAFHGRRQKEYDQELYKAIGHLKSICITNQTNPKNGDAILEELLRYTSLTRPIFAHTLSLMRLQQYETARTYFTSRIGTKLSRDFVHILLELDRIDPKEFVEQLKVFQEAEREKRLTERLNQQESWSLVCYVPAISVCMVIMLNFIMMTLWVNARTTFL